MQNEQCKMKDGHANAGPRLLGILHFAFCILHFAFSPHVREVVSDDAGPAVLGVRVAAPRPAAGACTSSCSACR